VRMDHADAEPDGVGRAADRDRAAVIDDLAGIRPGQAVDDVHQRALAGAVLAQQRVHLSPPDVEVDAVVGPERTVRLDDAAQDQRDVVGRGVLAPARRCGYELSAPVFRVPAASCFWMSASLAFMSAVTFE